MAEQTLRDALKELRAYCGRHLDDPRASEDEQVAYDDVCIQLAQILQRHPAGDGGLREALEKLAEKWAGARINPTHEAPSSQRLYGDGVEQGYEDAAGGLRAVLSAHPVVPAAPTDDGGLHEALTELADKFDDGRLLNVAGRALRQTLAAHPAAPAVPQPVDREALRERIKQALCTADGPINSRSADVRSVVLEQTYGKYADAVLAVLAGEQEQVER